MTHVSSLMSSTLAKRIIPCLDVADGRVVKGVNFVQLKDAGDPVEVAARYNEQSADEITFLDITASHEKRKTLFEMVEKVAKQVFIPLTVGGGVSTIADIRRLLSAGADKVSINSAAVKNPDLIDEATQSFGRQCIVIAIDAKTHVQNQSWHVYTVGGRYDTGKDVLQWSKEVCRRGAGEILLTSMDRDGTRTGFDNDLTNAVVNAVHIPVIASGGVGTLEDFFDGITKGKADAVLAAGVFHFGELSINQVKQYLLKQGIAIRLE